jgi:putative IMPACT (imprinted ancient) family translation regulator
LPTGLLSSGASDIMIDRSRFLGVAFPVADEASFVAWLEARRKEHPDASHQVWAYRIDAGHARSSDDGEPHGTGGPPLLDLLERQDLIRSAVIVTRYFGGKLLGRPGLLRAYREAAIQALAQAPRGHLGAVRRVTVRIPWEAYSSIRHEAKACSALRCEVADATGPLLQLQLEAGAMDRLLALLANLSAGRMAVEGDVTEESFIPD